MSNVFCPKCGGRARLMELHVGMRGFQEIHCFYRSSCDACGWAGIIADTPEEAKEALALTAPEMSIDEVIDWLHAIAQQTQALTTLDGKAAKIDNICLLAAELLSGFAAAEGHNRKDVSEICELQDRCENLTLYLDEIFRAHPSWKWALDKYHPGLPGYVEKSSGLEARRNEES